MLAHWNTCSWSNDHLCNLIRKCYRLLSGSPSQVARFRHRLQWEQMVQMEVRALGLGSITFMDTCKWTTHSLCLNHIWGWRPWAPFNGWLSLQELSLSSPSKIPTHSDGQQQVADHSELTNNSCGATLYPTFHLRKVLKFQGKWGRLSAASINKSDLPSSGFSHREFNQTVDHG